MAVPQNWRTANRRAPPRIDLSSPLASRETADNPQGIQPVDLVDMPQEQQAPQAKPQGLEQGAGTAKDQLKGKLSELYGQYQHGAGSQDLYTSPRTGRIYRVKGGDEYKGGFQKLDPDIELEFIRQDDRFINPGFTGEGDIKAAIEYHKEPETKLTTEESLKALEKLTPEERWQEYRRPDVYDEKAFETAKEQYRKEMGKAASEAAKYAIEKQNWEKELKEKHPDIYRIYQFEGLEAASKEIEKRNKKTEAKVSKMPEPPSLTAVRELPMATWWAAEAMVPGVGTARHWNDLSAGWKVAYIAGDIASIFPFFRAGTLAARTIPVAGKVARLKAISQALKTEAIAQLGGPADIVLHPLETAKMSGRQVAGAIEQVIDLRRLPEATITTSWGTVRLPVSKTTSAEEAMRISEKLMKLAVAGEEPLVEVNGVKYQLSRSPLMTELGGGAAHGTPSGELLSKGEKVRYKPGQRLGEQGIFVSHEPLPRFAEATARGKTGERPMILIYSKETAKKLVGTEKTYKGTAELELKFPIGEELPAVKQKLTTRVGPEGTKVVLGLEHPLNPLQLARLKAAGLIETLKAPLKEPITYKGLQKLSKVIDDAGNPEQAESLLRMRRIIDSIRRTESLPAILARIRTMDVHSPVRARLIREAERVISMRSYYPSPTRRYLIERERRSTEGGRRSFDDGRRTTEEGRRTERIDTPGRIDRLPSPDRQTRLLETPRRPGEPGRPGEPTRPSRPSRPPELPRPPKPPPKLLPLGEGATEEEKKEYIKKSGAAVAFRRGQLHGESVWHTFIAGQKKEIVTLGPAPVGAREVEGPGSVQKTLKQLYGHPFEGPLFSEGGAIDARIDIEGKQPRISFIPDRRPRSPITHFPRNRRITMR